MNQIAKLKIPVGRYYFQKGTEKLNYIQGLKKINFFIGANNSGKSYLLRSIISSKIEFIPRAIDILEVQNKLKKTVEKLEENLTVPFKKEESVRSLIDEFKNLSKVEFVSENENLASQLYIQLSRHLGNPIQTYGGYSNGIAIMGSDMEKTARHITDDGLQLDLLTVKDYFEPPKKMRRIYMPVVRSLRRFGGGSSDLIGEHFRSEYFSNNEKKILDIEIVTGFDFFSKVRSLLLGTHSERKQIAAYETFLSKRFFEGKPVALVPHEAENVLHIKIGNEQQRPIHELGDGLQSLIAMTYQICLNKGTTGRVVIEEPELYLHPGGLRIFIKAILEDPLFDHYQFFLSTHSNHLLDLSLDYDETATYSVHKILPESSNDEVAAEFKIESEDYGSDRSLTYLGVRNSSVFLANCTIWVEGVTDRWYLRKFLSLLPEKYKFSCYIEDLHFSIIEYAGSNITHWSFLLEEESPINVERLCGKAFLIADKDEKKTERHEALKKILGDRVEILPVREIENLLLPSVLQDVAKRYAFKTDDTSQWKIFAYSKYRNSKIGPFLDKHTPLKHKFTSKNGYLSGKGVFCKRVIERMNEWDDLSEDAKKLTIQVSQFIKRMNGNNIELVD